MGLIVPQIVRVKISGTICKYYREKGYKFEKCGDIIEVDVFDLPKRSRAKVKIICDVCGKEVEMRYAHIVKCNEENELITCGDKICRYKKVEDTCTKRYGVKSTNQLKTVKDKKINTCRKNYGVDNPSKSQEIKNKKIETCKKNFGCENPSQSQVVKDRKKKTFQNNFGCDSPLQCKEIQDKMKVTCKERYGYENAMQNEEIQNKTRETCMKKYGANSPFASKEIQNKVRKTWQEKYGKNIISPFQLESVKEKSKQTLLKNYGVDHSSKSSIIRDRRKVTCQEHFGVDYPSKSQEVKDKIKATNKEKYGVDWYIQSNDFKDKSKITNKKKYGVESAIQNEKIKNKALDSFHFNGTGPCSRQQKYIHFLIGGALNKRICGSLVDIYMEKEKIAIEYDGGGHFLTDMFNGNKIPSKEALLKEKEREDKIINNGYRMIRFIATKDRIPSDEVILNLIEEFKNSDFKVIRIDFEKGTIEKDYNEKSHYNFGKLRKITQKDLEQFESKKQ